MSSLLPLILAATVAWSPSQGATCPQTRQLTVTTLCLINQVRADDGAPRLRLDPRLSRVARHRYFSHTSRAGLSSSERIARSGWMRGRRRWAIGENLAWRQRPAGTPAGVGGTTYTADFGS